MAAPTATPPPSPLLAFIVGASLPAFAITFSYLGFAFHKTPFRNQIPFHLFPFLIPLLFGLANVINFQLIRYLRSTPLNTILAPLIVGALTGLIFSIIGRFGLDLPKKLFLMPPSTQHRVHPIAAVLYAVIFTFIITPLTRLAGASASGGVVGGRQPPT